MIEFQGYAVQWLRQKSRRNCGIFSPQLISTWQELKNAIRGRLVPRTYTTDLFLRLQSLKQGSKNVEEFRHELENMMLRLELQDVESTLARSLYRDISYELELRGV